MPLSVNAQGAVWSVIAGKNINHGKEGGALRRTIKISSLSAALVRLKNIKYLSPIFLKRYGLNTVIVQEIYNFEQLSGNAKAVCHVAQIARFKLFEDTIRDRLRAHIF